MEMTSKIYAQIPTQTATKPEGLSIEEKRERQRIYCKRWREKHKKQANEIQYRWNKKNKEKVNAIQRQWRRRNPKAYSAIVMKSQKKHIERYRAYQKQYRRKHKL